MDFPRICIEADSDERLWLRCACSWKTSLGFAPTTIEAIERESEHLLAIHSELVRGDDVGRHG